MALNCDFIFMAEDASIGFPEIGLGTFVGGGVTRHLPELVGLRNAKELVYTGRIISGKEAVDMGLAVTCLPIKQLMDETRAFARQLCDAAPVSIQLAKKRIQESGTLDLETVLQLETDGILTCMDTEDWHEGIRAFNEKRKPDYKGR